MVKNCHEREKPMIKDYKKIDPPDVELGNLTLENCSDIYVDANPDIYPVAWYGRINGDGQTWHVFPGHPDDCPEGFKIRQQFDNPTEALLDYASSLKEEHEGIPDSRLKDYAPFIGRKRSARWEDEAKRRGLR